MSAPAGAPPAAMEAAGPPPQVHQAQGPEAAKIHKVALDAQASLEQLATLLAQANADPGAVKAVSQMAGVTRKIITALAKAGQAEQPPAAAEPAQPHTMNSAADALQAQLVAKRQGGPTQ